MPLAKCINCRLRESWKPAVDTNTAAEPVSFDNCRRVNHVRIATFLCADRNQLKGRIMAPTALPGREGSGRSSGDDDHSFKQHVRAFAAGRGTDPGRRPAGKSRKVWRQTGTCP